ncbi:mRNA 3 end-processing YTH1 [Fusarium circinatum]|uniref:mRNA 3 end-processing YTH1 n=1 Tax=Fusarium circinatum TaxID=48490 RepID=A0A8H5U5N7_FUSCI|nr:mRNA 3 end-processing YTH1 [Fusarium circinatum]
MDKTDAAPTAISETKPRNPTEILPESIPFEMSSQGGQDLVAAQPLEENEEDVDDSALGEDFDFADQYPNAEVIGTDLSPIQPDWVPPNVRFELEDVTSFVESVKVNPTFFSDDETASDVTAVQTWNKLFREASKAFGRSFCEIEGDSELLAAAGFVDVQVNDFKVPVGGWAKDSKLRQVGQFLRATMENDLEGKKAIGSALQPPKKMQDILF